MNDEHPLIEFRFDLSDRRGESDHYCGWWLVAPNPWPYLPQIGTNLYFPGAAKFGGNPLLSFTVNDIRMRLVPDPEEAPDQPNGPTVLVSASSPGHAPHDFMWHHGFTQF